MWSLGGRDCVLDAAAINNGLSGPKQRQIAAMEIEQKQQTKEQPMHTEKLASRRHFLCLTASFATGIGLPAISHSVLAAENRVRNERGTELNPLEDLMREHGVLRRVLSIYEEAIRRIDKGEHLPPGVIADSAGIVRRFVEDYHEKLEEDEIFPRFEKAGKLDDIAKILFVQHQAGRRLTDSVLKLSESEAPKNAKEDEEEPVVRNYYGGRPLFWKTGKKEELSSAMQMFIRMYRPHTDWEDTALFPAFRTIVSRREFEELGEKFEEKELFGKEGFETMICSVGEIEKKLGIHDLSTFTAKI